TLTLLLTEHPRVSARYRAEIEAVQTTVITHIEILGGRFAFVMKAPDGEQLLRAQALLRKTQDDLVRFPAVQINDVVAEKFDQLRANKKLKKIGRADLLIACTALAYDAVLVTRNLRHFQLVPGLRLENWAD